MPIIIDGVTFVLTMISITASIIFAIVQTYAKLRSIFHETIREIIRYEIMELRNEIELLKESNIRLEHEIDEIKRKLEERR